MGHLHPYCNCQNQLVSGLNLPFTIAASGGNLFFVNGKANVGTIGEYSTSGATVNAALIVGFKSPRGIAASGSNLFVADTDSFTIGEYTTSGATVNPSLITGVYSQHIAVFGSNLFVSDDNVNTVSEYTTAGATVNAALIAGLNLPESIAVSGSNLFVANLGDEFEPGSGSIGEDNAITGATVDLSLITGLDGPFGIAVSGSHLFVANNGTVTNGTYDPGSGSIGEYTTSGATVNAALITRLNNPHDITVVPEHAGDVNFDGIVNGLDISLIASHWLQTGNIQADANGDENVNGLDIAIVASHCLQTGGAGNRASVPETSTLILVALSGLALLAYRWRRSLQSLA